MLPHHFTILQTKAHAGALVIHAASKNGTEVRLIRRGEIAPRAKTGMQARVDARQSLQLPAAMGFVAAELQNDGGWLAVADVPGPTLYDWETAAVVNPAFALPAVALGVVAQAAEALHSIYVATEHLPGGLARDIVLRRDGTVWLGSLGELEEQARPSEHDQVSYLLEILRTLAGPNRPRSIDIGIAQLVERRLMPFAQILRDLAARPEFAVAPGAVASLADALLARGPAPAVRQDWLDLPVPERADTEPTQSDRTYTPENRPPDVPSRDEARSDRPGDVVGNTYRLTRSIGEGSMGQVFEAQHLATFATVAVKVVHRESAASGEFTERFRREASTMAMLDHPHIVGVHDYGSRGCCWLAMEHVPGPSLATVLRRDDRLTTHTALEIARQVAIALEHAHSRGIIHRDVKPANILFASQDPVHIKLCDFGLAKSWDDVDYTANGTLVGTPQYMSPEQCFGRAATPSSDLYSVGIILFRMLTGHTPFESHIGAAVLLAHTTQRADTLEAATKERYPDIIQEVVDRCLEKDVEDRYVEASLLIEDLTRCIARLENPQEPTPALTYHTRRSRTEDPPVAPRAPKPRLWMAAVAMGMVIGLATFAWLMQS